MGQRIIFTDDLTDKEIDANAVTYAASLTLSIVPKDAKDAVAVEYKADWDVSANTQAALYALVEESDLATFILRMRPMVSLKDAVDSDVIRKWVKDAHPEIKIKDRGRVPADVKALYNREVIQRVNAGDSAK